MPETPVPMLRSIGPKLIPFFKSVCFYFLSLPEQPSLQTVCYKCMPIISLMFFISLQVILSKEHTFNSRIFTGLVFSCFGDAFLVWPSCFVLGMAMFAVAQVMYISAFGFYPINAKLGAIVYGLCAVVTYTLMPGLQGVLKIGVPVYTLLLATMSWRAIAKVPLFQKECAWTRVCRCIGSICFVISDTLIGFHNFYSPVPYPHFTIMLTYYAAQLGIALSAIEPKSQTVTNS